MSIAIKNHFFNLTNKSEINFFSRATVGIFCFLKVINQRDKFLVFPSTICPSPIYAAIFANVKTIFCDVNLSDGNINISSVNQLFKKNRNKILGVFAPNMYGNPCGAEKLKKITNKHSSFFIEDCAQSQGTIAKKKYTGSYGDISIFSFGYSKNVDIGQGGLILSDDKNLRDGMQKVYQKLNNNWQNNKLLNIEYKKKYFKYFSQNKKKGFLKFINLKRYKNLFLQKRSDSWLEKLENKIKKINNLKRLNKKKFNLYKKTLGKKFKFMNIETNSFPWRFNIFYDEKKRDKKLEIFWKMGGNANKLYPCIPKFLFGQKSNFSNSIKIEKKIVNFPLHESLNISEIEKNCNLALKIF